MTGGHTKLACSFQPSFQQLPSFSTSCSCLRKWWQQCSCPCGSRYAWPRPVCSLQEDPNLLGFLYLNRPIYFDGYLVGCQAWFCCTKSSEHFTYFVFAASGDPDQPYSLSLDRNAVTGGSAAAAPGVNAAVEQILNPRVSFNSVGRHRRAA